MWLSFYDIGKFGDEYAFYVINDFVRFCQHHLLGFILLILKKFF